MSLRDLHVPGRPVVLPNAWDAGSARLFAEAGFGALATSSSAVAESLGYADHEETPADEMFGAIARITRAVDVPVTADIESGYGLSATELATQLRSAGAAGCNLEDSDPATGVLQDPASFAAWIAELRAAAGDDLVINARVDPYVVAVRAAGSLQAAAEVSVDESIERARAYLAAGADCVYPILAPPDALAEIVKALDAPVNALSLPGGPSIAELAALGVARITFGGGLYNRASAFVRTLAADLRAG